MANPNQVGQVTVGAGIYGVDATQQHPLGTKLELAGRVFRYCEAGGAITKATGCVAPTPEANHLDLSVAAAVVGAKTVNVTLGATAAAENLYAEGYMLVVDGTGEGDMYRITGHAAVASAGAGDFYLADGLETALVASGTSQVSLFQNPYKNVVGWGATPATKLIGIPLVTIADTEFFWAQTSGPGICDGSGTGPVDGDPLIAGASGTVTVAAAITDQIVGVCMKEGPASGEMVFLDIKLDA